VHLLVSIVVPLGLVLQLVWVSEWGFDVVTNETVHKRSRSIDLRAPVSPCLGKVHLLRTKSSGSSLEMVRACGLEEDFP
jgi:hypothetical protein